MPLKEKFVSIFNKVKGSGRLWWLKQIDEYPKVIMLDVIIALLPACIFGCILFGFKALLTLVISAASAVLAEFLWNLIFKKPQTANDLSALVTGLLFGMCLPGSIPIWIVLTGNVFAVIVVKQLLGGLGYNLTNPAVTSLILLSFCFPKIMTEFHLPFSQAGTDLESASFLDLFFGLHSGGIGETASFLLIVGGIYLIIRRIISPIIPLTFIGSVALLSLIFSQNVLVALFGGGLILGAFFMATDYTTSPTTNSGKVLFGFGCGILSFIIHMIFRSYDGVTLAILIMNILLALYNRLGLGKYKEPVVAKITEVSAKIINICFEKIKVLFQKINNRLRKS